MSYELVYTSAPRGLKQSAGGYCTVAADGGLPRSLAMKLEMLSPYQFHYKLTDADVSNNPVNYSHTIVLSGGEMHSVLSRVAFCGTDYSGRINKIAHHFLLTDDEKLPVGPARMLKEMERLELLAKRWEKKPEALASRRLNELLAGVEPGEPQPAQAWAQLGNAGWAGELARAFRTNKKIPAYLIFEPGMDVLPLYEESLALLPPQERWQVCFSTYYTSLPPGADCHWRAVLAGTQAAKEASRYPQAVVIDITKPLPPAPENEFTQAAMTGAVVYAAQGSQPAGAKTQSASDAKSGEIDEKIRRARERMREAEPIEISEYETAKIKSLQYLPNDRRKTPLALTIALGVIAAILLVTNAVTFRQLKSELQRQEIQLADAATTPENGGKTQDEHKADAEGETDSGVTETQNQQEVEEKDEQKHREGEQEPAEDNGSEGTSKEEEPDEKDGAHPPEPIKLVKRSDSSLADLRDLEVVEPIREGDAIRFELPSRPTHVVQVPDAISGMIEWEEKSDNVYKLVYVDNRRWDIGDMTLVPDGDQWLMQFRKQDDLDTTRREYMDAFVIELADSETQTVYQCPLGQLRPIEQEFRLELDARGTVKGDSGKEIPYPWESQPLFNDEKFSVHANIPTQGDIFAKFIRKDNMLYFELLDKKPLPKEVGSLVTEVKNINGEIMAAQQAITKIIETLEQLKNKEEQAQRGNRFPTYDTEKLLSEFHNMAEQLKRAATEADRLLIGQVHDPWGPLLRVYLKVVAESKEDGD